MFGPSLIVAPMVSNPVVGLGAAVVFSCIDSGDCRTAVYAMVIGYDVKPDSQFLTAQFCSDTSFNISVTNPLKSGDIQVLENGLPIGEVARGRSNILTVKIDGRKPLDLPELYATEERSFGIDAKYLRGDIAGDLLDKNKSMGKTIYANISWNPSDAQMAAYESISALNESIIACVAKNIPNTAIDSKINESRQVLEGAIYNYKNCNFQLSNAKYQADALTYSCVEAPMPVQQKGLFDAVSEYWWLWILIIIGLVVLWWIFK